MVKKQRKQYTLIIEKYLKTLKLKNIFHGTQFAVTTKISR